VKQGQEALSVTSEVLVDMLNEHARRTLEKSSSNSHYAENVKVRAQEVKTLNR
jgi:hypothetical protein